MRERFLQAGAKRVLVKPARASELEELHGLVQQQQPGWGAGAKGTSSVEVEASAAPQLGAKPQCGSGASPLPPLPQDEQWRPSAAELPPTPCHALGI